MTIGQTLEHPQDEPPQLIGDLELFTGVSSWGVISGEKSCFPNCCFWRVKDIIEGARGKHETFEVRVSGEIDSNVLDDLDRQVFKRRFGDMLAVIRVVRLEI